MNMNIHLEALKRLCRLCGSKIIENKHYKAKPALSYENVIENAYKIHLAQDSNDIHPKNICKNCYLKLYHLSKKSITVQEQNNIKLVKFQEHHNEECHVCNSMKAGAPRKVVSPFADILLILKSHQIKVKECSETELKLVMSKLHKDIVITVFSDFTWAVTVSVSNKERAVPENSKFLTALPKQFTNATVSEILNSLDNATICPGNGDFPLLVASRLQDVKTFQSVSKETVAHIETSDGCTLNDFYIIRHKDCSILIDSQKRRCDDCSLYRKTLTVLEKRENEEPKEISISSKTNDRYLSDKQKLSKLKALKQERKKMIVKVVQMQNKIAKLIEREGMSLKDEDHNVMKEVINKENCPFKEETPQYLLWQQQKLQASLASKKAMKWHPVIVRWCISIYLKSPGTYKHLRSSPFLNLPCKNTLLKYINFSEPGCGFNVDIIENLIKKLNIPSMLEREKHVSLIFDEMKIKCNILFSRTTGKIVGYNEMGSINDELEMFEKQMNENPEMEPSESRSLASYVIVFMVRGIGSSLCYPLGHFASNGFSSDQIYHTAWESIGILESIGLKVHAVVADGAAPNRKFIRLHKLSNGENVKDGVVFWTWNEWCPERRVYFICNVPHLLKTIRNNLENSGGNFKTRNLMYNGQEMGWNQIIRLYELDLGLSHGQRRDAVGLRMGHKLKEEMIRLTPRSRMVVSYAAKVLSSTTVYMLEEQNDNSTESLRHFIKFVDKFFDCLNVSRLVNKTRKPELEAYRTVDDFRFKWLQEEFLGFFKEWENQVKQSDGFEDSEKKKMCLSYQTLEGLRITVHSFVSLCKELLTECSFEYVLSEKFSQDNLEEYFSKQRFRGGCNDNPTLEEFNRNTLALHVAGDESIRVTTGNTRGRNRDSPTWDINDCDLPKIKRLKR